MLSEKIIIGWLKQLLSDGPVPVQQILTRSRVNGISRPRLKQIKKFLKIKSVLIRKDNEMVCAWMWPYKKI